MRSTTQKKRDEMSETERKGETNAERRGEKNEKLGEDQWE